MLSPHTSYRWRGERDIDPIKSMRSPHTSYRWRGESHSANQVYALTTTSYQRISYQRETRDCCVICLTETWMSATVPDSAIELTGFSVHRSDRTKELTGKSRGGGVCFYINNSWCNERNIHSIKSFCSPDLEFHTLLCRPFWLLREFTAIIITAVYIPP